MRVDVQGLESGVLGFKAAYPGPSPATVAAAWGGTAPTYESKV